MLSARRRGARTFVAPRPSEREFTTWGSYQQKASTLLRSFFLTGGYLASLGSVCDHLISDRLHLLKRLALASTRLLRVDEFIGVIHEANLKIPSDALIGSALYRDIDVRIREVLIKRLLKLPDVPPVPSPVAKLHV